MPALRSARERARYFVTMRTAEALKHRTIKLMPVIHGYDLRMALASSLLGAIWYQIACVITDGAEGSVVLRLP